MRWCCKGSWCGCCCSLTCLALRRKVFIVGLVCGNPLCFWIASVRGSSLRYPKSKPYIRWYLETHLKPNDLVLLIFLQFWTNSELVVLLVLLAVSLCLFFLGVDADGRTVEFVGEVVGIAEELLLHFYCGVL